MTRVSRLVGPLITARAAALVIGILPATAKQQEPIRLDPLTTFDSESGEGGAEIAVLDNTSHLLLVANEGEPRCIDVDGFGVTDPSQAINPEGSSSIIDLVGGQPGAVATVDFTAFNGHGAALKSDGVRVGTWPGASISTTPTTPKTKQTCASRMKLG